MFVKEINHLLGNYYFGGLFAFVFFWYFFIRCFFYFVEVAAKTETGHFNLADERYLAIAFGSATVALLILIVIIVISVVRRGNG